ncbi:MAG: fibronectin type III domain-containing protein, partial [Treponemataceae bacterium]|nr:fibronectin type III domain-containing protein [Treponemataceae bacterium]
MKPVKSVLFAVPAAAVIVAVLFAASCNNALLPEPEIEQLQGSVVNKDAQIEAPLTVKATQGKTKTVTVSWSTSNGATQYVVYSAASPHEEFQQVAETKGEVNSIDIQEPAGTSAYYRVCARNYKKELSDFSDTVFGSTMATPIISDITSSTDGTSATVSWWMENCSASTYQNLVNYVVYCYDESGNEVTHETASGGQTSAVLSGLTAKTRYFYQVEAFVSADQSKPELSDKVDEETARRLIPDAPENLSATKGTDKATIAISWMLPPFCDVAVSGGVYERHPLYFTVERKLKGDDDTKYQKIVTYLGTQEKELTSASVIQFSCAADSAATSEESLVSVQPAAQSDADAERSDNYEHYISRSIVTYYDTTAERGLQYEYRVQSYVDDVKKTISAENAAAVAQGFLLSKPTFSASAKYDRAADDNNIITKITVSFKTVFEPYGQDYSYILCRNYEPMLMNGTLTGTSDSDHKITTAESISTLNTTTDKFDFGTKDLDIGYYQYVLYICASGENDIAKAYDSITMSGKITVIDKANLLPTITRFDIVDGYADKFRLTWNYENTCHYRLEWKSSLDNFTEVQTLDMDKDGKEIFTQENGLATYDHPAQSGERRFYTLVANGGIEVSKTYPLPKDGDEGVPEPQELATLGTAVPQTVDIGYRMISVSWPEVQRATGDFDIKAYYAGTN